MLEALGLWGPRALMGPGALLFFVAGLALLVLGGEALVRGASRLASIAGISPLVIGLTVVAFGTSAPELAVSLNAALAGQADIALGNVVGSNIFNVLFILGVSALVVPLAVSARLVRLDVPLMIAASILVYVLGLDGRLDRAGGALLTTGLVAYTAFAVMQSRWERQEIQEEYAQEFGPVSGARRRLLTPVVLIAVGLMLLVLGSRWLVAGAVTLARLMGVSELIIGLTVVAAGTSLPEVATSFIAAIRGERDIAVGNVVGSNLFNLLGVLGLASLVTPGGIRVTDAAVRFDFPVMIAVAVACLPIFVTGHLIARWEGGLFLGYYGAYLLYLLLDAAGHDALPAYSRVMLLFVLPLTAITLLGLMPQRGRGAGP